MGSWKFITEVIGFALVIILLFLVWVLLKTYDYGFNSGLIPVG
jgi:hypothetical protein